MKVPKIFLSKKNPRCWDEYWKRSRQIPPRNPYLYHERTISTEEVDRYFDRMVCKYKWEQRLEVVKNFMQNIVNGITNVFDNISKIK